jgi:hypothetical protein
MKAILIATIGNRDLMFQIKSGEWYNVGETEMKESVLEKSNILTENLEVISDLELRNVTYRDLTQYLLEHWDDFKTQIKPVILGKIFLDKSVEIEKVYLVGTNQLESVTQRDKDTLYSCKLIKCWLQDKYPNIQVEILELGQYATDPSNFEQMFQWWLKMWKTQINPKPEQTLWVCLKGGVGQTAEAARISGLSLYGEQVKFYEFKQNFQANHLGIPSDYSGPFLGTTYLWNRTQKQVLKLLERYDYAGVLELLEPYFKQDMQGWGNIPNLVNAGLEWNRGQFENFFQKAQSGLDKQQKRQRETYWWMAYEQAYIGVIRFQQKNTTEAMLHSYRAVEGLIYEWIKNDLKNYIIDNKNEYLLLNKKILNKYDYPELQEQFHKLKEDVNIQVRGTIPSILINNIILNGQRNADFDGWANQEAKNVRNFLSHNLGGINDKDLFKAWGQDIKNQKDWENRILTCLNLIANNNFSSLYQASLFACTHHKIKQKITSYDMPL